jgi:4-hydroxybenzoate polyprenyltransferase
MVKTTAARVQRITLSYLYLCLILIFTSSEAFRPSSYSFRHVAPRLSARELRSHQQAARQPGLLLAIVHNHEENSRVSPQNTISRLIGYYLDLIRPYTLLQAVGALLVGSLALNSKQLPSLSVCLSVYLSYGAGMVVNDLADVRIDAMHLDKRYRAIPSGRISRSNASIFVATLAISSLFLAIVGSGRAYALWIASNLALMILYALGLQKVFLLKNLIVGWLGVSPLVGAVILFKKNHVSASVQTAPLLRLAAVGFAVGVAREILKDMEDVEVDQLAGKMTLPIVVGNTISHRISFFLVAAACVACLSPGYRAMFSLSPPLYLVATWVGVVMCVKASLLPLQQGQRMLKKSVYVLLAGMISTLVAKQ